MGKSAAKKSEQLQSEAANRFSQLATDLTTQAKPANDLVQQYYTNAIKGGPEAYKAIAPAVDFTKRQFQNARQTLNESAPAGGARQRGYKALAGQQATTVSGLFRDKINEFVAKLQQMGQFGTQAGLSATGGVQSSGAGLGELSAARANAVAGGLGGIAGAVGTYFGMKP